jgi:hypothetical protein
MDRDISLATPLPFRLPSLPVWQALTERRGSGDV